MLRALANPTTSFRLAGFLGWTLVLLAVPAHAQQNRLGAFFGGSLAQSRPIQGLPGQSVQISSAFAAGLHYDHAFKLSRFVVPRLEAELTVVPPRLVKSLAAAVPRNYSAIYATPGIAVEFLPYTRLRPWVAAGGGYTLFLQSQVLTNGQKFSVHTKNGAAFDYGGGLDFGLLRAKRSSFWHIDLRAQVRDFVSGNPELNVPLQSGVQHNVIAAGGILFAF